MEHKYFFLTMFWAIFIASLSLVSINSIAINIVSGQDKFFHFVFYAIFSILLKLSFTNNMKNIWVFLIVFIYGIIIEVMQGELTRYREPDIVDALANAFGALVGLLILHFVRKTYKIFK